MLEAVRERLKSPPDDGGVWTARKAAAFMAAELGLARVAEQRGWEALARSARADGARTGGVHLVTAIPARSTAADA